MKDIQQQFRDGSSIEQKSRVSKQQMQGSTSDSLMINLDGSKMKQHNKYSNRLENISKLNK